MKTLARSDIPEGYAYYRSHTPSFAAWMQYLGYNNVRIDLPDGSFGWVVHFFFWLFSFARFEKLDTEPTRELLTRVGMRRGFVHWSPWRRIDMPSGWKKLGKWSSQDFHHASRSAFSVLDDTPYERKWCDDARQKRRKIHKMIAEGRIRIDTNANPEIFLEAYSRARVSQSSSLKKFLLRRQRFFFEHTPEAFRTYLAYVDDQPMAGAVFLDDIPTSTYLIAFQDARAKEYHLGLAIIDAWFQESTERGFRFLDFDHMRDVGNPKSYQGYTDFKSRLAEYELYFSEVWGKWM